MFHKDNLKLLYFNQVFCDFLKLEFGCQRIKLSAQHLEYDLNILEIKHNFIEFERTITISSDWF